MDQEPLEHDTVILVKSFNEHFVKETGKTLQLTEFSILKDDIKNYRKLSERQLSRLKLLSEREKIEIIEIYDYVVQTMAQLLDV